jgi:hypothetical protein
LNELLLVAQLDAGDGEGSEVRRAGEDVKAEPQDGGRLPLVNGIELLSKVRKVANVRAIAAQRGGESLKGGDDAVLVTLEAGRLAVEDGAHWLEEEAVDEAETLEVLGGAVPLPLVAFELLQDEPEDVVWQAKQRWIREGPRLWRLWSAATAVCSGVDCPRRKKDSARRASNALMTRGSGRETDGARRGAERVGRSRGVAQAVSTRMLRCRDEVREEKEAERRPSSKLEVVLLSSHVSRASTGVQDE